MDQMRVTAMQEAMLVESQALSSTNVLQWVWRIPAALSFERLQSSIKGVVANNDVLSSYFVEEQGAFYQSSKGKSVNNVSLHQVSLAEPIAIEELLEAYLLEDRRLGFDTVSSPPFRSKVFLGSSATCCVFSFHAALMDNWGFTLFIEELIGRFKDDDYQARTVNHFYEFLSLNKKSELGFSRPYWRRLLRGGAESPIPNLPKGVMDSAPKNFSDQITAIASEKQFMAIKAFSSSAGVSIESVLEASWALLLHRYCNMDSLVFGASGQFRQVFNRDFSAVIGSFFNTLPVTVDLQSGMTVAALLVSLEEQRNHRFKSPHDPLLSVLQLGSSKVAHLSTGFNVESAEWQSVLESSGAPWADAELTSIYQSSFDLACNVRMGKGLSFILDYSTDKFDRSSADQLLRHYQNILLSILSDVDQHVFDVGILDAGDYDLLFKQARNVSDGPVFDSIPNRITHVASNYPAAVAITDGELQITYAELARKADVLAAKLLEWGVDRSSVVAAVLPRSADFVISVIAVMRAGGAYLPIDPSEPKQRLCSMLRDARVSIALTRANLSHLLEGTPLEVLIVDEYEPTVAADSPVDFPKILEGDSAYVIFTSGTTGTPKGVLIEHGALSNHCSSMTAVLGVVQSDIALQFASTIFDVHVEEIFTTLCAGANLVIRSDMCTRSAREFVEFIEQSQISILNIPSAFWIILVEEIESGALEWPEYIKTLIVGGERVASASFAKYRKQNVGHIQFINGYGPTEATITSTVYQVPSQFSDMARETEKLSRDSLPIGKPIRGLSHFVLDRHKRLVPPKVVGFLYIGGKGVAKGYLQNEALTNERFTVLPQLKNAVGRYYASGDSVYSDGEDLFFVGRSDHQVKIRGYRIELGEVEAALKSFPNVSNVIVEVDPDRIGVLVGMIEEGRKAVDPVILKNQLSDYLPEYMVPNDLLCFNRFPLTRAGKVDRKELWRLFRERKLTTDVVDSVLTETQKRLVECWRVLLGPIQVSTTDSFFELGGHSLLAVKLFSKIEKDFNCSVPLREFFQNPTILNLETLIDNELLRGQFQSPESDFSIGNLHPLQAKGDGCPLYCICGVDLYQELANELGESQPVYGIFLPVEEKMLHSFRQLKTEFTLPSTEEMAADYVRVIRQNQPFGPYKLAGLSFGGILAYEISQQLVADGEIVETLILIDSFVPLKRRVFSYQQMRHRWERIKSQGFSQVVSAFKKFESMYKSRQRERKLKKNVSQLDDNDFQLYRHIVYRQSALNYGPKISPYPGEIILIHAESGGGEAEGVNSSDHGWGKYAQGGLKCFNVSGDHIGVLKQPHVKSLAENVMSAVQSSKYNTDGNRVEQ